MGITVESFAGVVGVEGDDALEARRPEFLFEQPDRRAGGIFPELAIQIEAIPVVTRPRREPMRIDRRLDRKMIAGGEVRLTGEAAEKPGRRERTGGFVAMDAAEQAKPDEVMRRLGSDEFEPMQAGAVRHA